MTSADHAKAATITFDQWCERMRTGRYTGLTAVQSYKHTAWYKAGKALEAETHPTPPPPPAPLPPGTPAYPPPPSAAPAQFVLFAAQEPGKALASPAKYCVAFSADPAYRDSSLPTAIRAYRDKGHRVAGWCDCRVHGGTPAADGTTFVKEYELDYFIGQAETQAEFDNAMTVKAPVVVGNITNLRQDQIDHIMSGAVLFIQEDYWNEGWARAQHPAITAYCAGIYPTALWNPQIHQYQTAGRWRYGDGLYHVAAVEDWQNLQ